MFRIFLFSSKLHILNLIYKPNFLLLKKRMSKCSKWIIQVIIISYMALVIKCGFFLDSVIEFTSQPIKFITQNQKEPRMLINGTFQQIFMLTLNYTYVSLGINLYNKNFINFYETPVWTQGIYYRTILLQMTNGGYTINFYSQDFAYVVSYLANPPSNQFWFAMGELPNQYYFAYNNLSLNESTIERNYISSNVNICFIKNASAKIYEIFQQNGHLYSFFYGSQPSSLLFQVFDILPNYVSFVYEVQFIVTDLSVVRLELSQNLLLIYDGSFYKIYSLLSASSVIQLSYLQGGNSINSADLIDIKFFSSWVFLSLPGIIKQYDVTSGRQISYVRVLHNSPRISFIEEQPNCYIVIWETGSTIVYRMQIDSSNVFYLFLTNQITTTAQFDTGLGYQFFINPCQGCLKPSNSSSESPSFILDNGTCLQSDTICKKLCQKNCLLCQRETCLECRFGTQYLQQSGCQIQRNLSILIKIIALVHLLPVRDTGKLYLLINSLGFHQYHKKNYSKVIKDLFDFTNYIQQQLWKIVDFQQVMDIIDEPYLIPSYAEYTNVRFFQIEQRDSFLLQNTRDFFYLSLPISILLFVLTNLLYRILSSKKVKLKFLFEVFAYLYGIVFVSLIQNITRLVFLSCHHLLGTFYLNYVTLFLQALSIIFIGMILILITSFFFLYRYFHHKSYKQFVENFNIGKTKRSYFLLLLVAVVRPTLEIVINVFLYDYFDIMILLTASLQSLIFILECYYQIMHKIYYNKKQFVEETTTILCLSSFNFFIFLQDTYSTTKETDSIFEDLLTLHIYLLSSILGLSVLRCIFSFVAFLFGQIRVFYVLPSGKDNGGAVSLPIRQKTGKNKKIIQKISSPLKFFQNGQNPFQDEPQQLKEKKNTKKIFTKFINHSNHPNSVLRHRLKKVHSKPGPQLEERKTNIK